MIAVHGFKRLALLSISAGWLAASSVPSQAYSAFYVFGDSLSDVGNVYTATGGALPAPPYVGGRFTNGPTWADDVAASLHLAPLKASLQGGTDYAFGYATASDAVPNPDPKAPKVPNLETQIGAYTQTHGGAADGSALYAVWIGANDVLNAIGDLVLGKIDQATAVADLKTAAEDEAAALQSLVSLGAKNLIVGLVPDVGKAPALNGDKGLSTLASGLAAGYNAALEDAAGKTFDYFDTYSLLDDAVDHPGKYGLTNVDAACFGGTYTSGGSACADPNKYLFWDSVHPTQVGHRAIADLALQTLGGGVTAVPLPGSVALFGMALAVLGLAAAVRRRVSAPPVGSTAISAAPRP